MKKLKKILTTSILSLSIGFVFAQTPTSIENNSKVLDVSTQGISPKNPWIGGQVGYKFGGTKEFADNLIVSARLLQEIDLGDSKFHLPVMGNLAVIRDNVSDSELTDEEKIEAKTQEILTSTQGINVGLYPYFVVTEKPVFSFILHGQIGYKLNALKDTQSEIQYLNQGRFSLGFEALIGRASTTTGKYPLTVSVTPVLTIFDENTYAKVFNEKKSNLFSLEITGVVPVGRGIGLLFEGIISESNVLRTGFLISSELLKADDGTD